MYQVPVPFGHCVPDGAGLALDWSTHGPNTENPAKLGWCSSIGAAAAISAASSLSFLLRSNAEVESIDLEVAARHKNLAALLGALSLGSPVKPSLGGVDLAAKVTGSA